MMKLKQIEHQKDYFFQLTFENGESRPVDLHDLISTHVSKAEVLTARVNHEWGCLEFKDGTVDIEPKTLYNFVKDHSNKVH